MENGRASVGKDGQENREHMKMASIKSKGDWESLEKGMRGKLKQVGGY